MTSDRGKRYCSVFGCLNNNFSNPDLSFFTIPTEQQTRLQWLRTIDREDLANKSKLDVRVCEVHFKAEAIAVNSKRKRLMKNCLPSLHLPNIKVDKETQVDVMTGSTSTQIDLLKCNVSCQTENISTSEYVIPTTASFSADTSRKRKLQSILSNLENRLNFNEIGQTAESQRNMFFELCDRFLSKNCADIVKAQVLLKYNYKDNRYTLVYKMFCLNLYYAGPQAYRLLQQTLCLPCQTTLYKLCIPITTQVNEDLIAALKSKVNNMSDREKQCTLVVGAMRLKTNLFYNIKDDKIIGFHEIDGVQSPSPANYALVVLVRGIFIAWSQPIGFALLSECKSDDNVSKWIDKIILKLSEIGLKIRVFVSDLGSGLLNAAKKREISVEKTYFTVNDHKIYYIFDAPQLIKLVRNNFMTYDFHLLNGGVVKYEHIVKFYEGDKNKTFRQAYKLTNSHINPTNFEKRKVRYATQLLSRSVAAGLSTYIDFKIIDESARETVEFIKNMNDLFDALNSSTYRHSYAFKNAFCGNTNQIDFFNKMLMLFRTLKLYNANNITDVTKTVKFIDGFQITIKSIIQLYDDFKHEGYKYLLTRRLNQDVIENFFGKIRSKNGVATTPTSRQFISAYRKIYFTNIAKAPKEGNCSEDLTEFLINFKNHQYFETDAREVDEHPTSSNSDNNQAQDQENVLCEILRSDYAQFALPGKKSFLYICGALFKKCVDYHKHCEVLTLYVDVIQRACNLSAATNYTYNKNDGTDRNLLMVPPEDFIVNIERMEQVFRKAFEKDFINIKIGTSIFKLLKDIEFAMPCPCFPKIFLFKLYVRMRIYFTLTANNKAFRTCRNRRKYFAVSNL